MDDRRYFDARFDGLEKLMLSQDKNMKDYIGGVSFKVSKVADELTDHKESTDAHGLGSNRNSSSVIASWLGLIVAFGVLVVEFIGRYRK